MLYLSFLLFFSNKPGNTTLAKHSIKTTTNTPIWSPAYTIPVHIEAKFKEELDNLLADVIIEESDSPTYTSKKERYVHPHSC